ncbi:MAG: trypsin-like peptidase domain-containing protein [Acidobacteriota bacterium]
MVRSFKLGSIFALCFASILFGAVLGGGLESLRHPAASPHAKGSWLPHRALAAGADGMPASFADIAEEVNPAVVFVQVTEVGRREQQLPPGIPEEFHKFFRIPQQGEPEDDEFRREGAGSGVIIDPSGWILTNNHVIQSATKVMVKLADDRQFKAEVKGADRDLDVALLKIDGQNLPVAALGDSDALRVGDWVMAIGNPFVYEHTVTVGVVSHKGRSNGNPFQQFIQTDAAINFGNSGGPLLNTRGEVVGINTAISSVGQGIGFAIPINRVKDIMEDLKSKGKVARGFLGVTPQSIDEDLVASFKLPSKDGALVVEVKEDTPAERAGIQVDDVITAVEGKPVKNREDLFHIVGATTPETNVAIRVLRENGKGSGRWAEKTLTARLEERNAKSLGEPEDEEAPGDHEGVPGKKLGVDVSELGPEMRRELRVPEKVRGCVVTRVSPSGAAADAGISEGDVIVEIDGRPVADATQFKDVVAQLKPGAKARLRLYHQGAPRVLTITVGDE